MANQEHLDILKQGVEVWNKWRQEHPDINPDLSGADLRATRLKGVNFRKTNLRKSDLSRTNFSNADLSEADLKGAYLRRAYLRETNLSRANLSGNDLIEADIRLANLSKADLSKAVMTDAYLFGANLSEANLFGADLIETTLSEADLSEADLSEALLKRANLRETNLSRANLSGADLSRATLVGTNLSQANLTDCRIYGMSAWDVQLEGAIQNGLVISLPDQAMITVDHLEVAQFIYLLLSNTKIRDIIDTIAKKVVLILGRFTPERKAVLDALRDELRKHDYLPVLFDFDKPESRGVTETVTTLAHLSRFIIADLTDPRSIPQELALIVPALPSVPIQPLLQISGSEYGMFEHFMYYPWVQPLYQYRDVDELLHSIQECIIDPAEKRVRELAVERAKKLEKP